MTTNDHVTEDWLTARRPFTPVDPAPTTPGNPTRTAPAGDDLRNVRGPGRTGTGAATAEEKKDKSDKPKQGQGDIDFEGLRNRIIVTDKERTGVTFDDIAGLDNVVDQVKELVTQLQFSSFFTRWSADMPSGILLWGSPGTGKTMIATALANSANVAFLKVKCSDINSKWVGEPEKNADAIFDIAHQEALKHQSGHAVLFLDEVEALLRSRDLESHESSEKVLSIFLQRMQGLGSQGTVTVIAATNRKDKLDSAFISRMDASLEVPLPNESGRAAIIKANLALRERKVGKEIAVENIAYAAIGRLFTGPNGENIISGRDIDKLMNRVVKNKAMEMVKIYQQQQAETQPKDAVAGNEAEDAAASALSKKIEIGPEDMEKLVEKVGYAETRDIIEAAKTFSKTEMFFDKNRDVDYYMKRLETILEEIAPAEKATKSEQEERDELIDELKRRIEKDSPLLGQLYTENTEMPEKIRGLVSAYTGKQLEKDETLKLLEELRSDTSIKAPKDPGWDAVSSASKMVKPE